jgi:hypothetical protein
MRRLAAALLILNGLVLAWWLGFLSPLLEPPGASEREPLRWSRQLKPEAIQLLEPAPLAPSSAGSASRGGASSPTGVGSPP